MTNSLLPSQSNEIGLKTTVIKEWNSIGFSATLSIKFIVLGLKIFTELLARERMLSFGGLRLGDVLYRTTDMHPKTRKILKVLRLRQVMVQLFSLFASLLRS
jgi:hypothetical protein